MPTPRKVREKRRDTQDKPVAFRRTKPQIGKLMFSLRRLVYRSPLLLVTGCGRSGTKYTSELLKACGLTCGHETIFSPYGPVMVDKPVDAECSWLAVPFLHAFEGYVVHQVRHPLACARSHLGISFFERDTVYSGFARKHLPELKQIATPLGQFVAFWTVWNEHAEQRASFTQRVESIDYYFLRRMLPSSIPGDKLAQALRNVPRNLNHRTRDDSVTMDNLLSVAGKYRTRFLACMDRYGYRKEER